MPRRPAESQSEPSGGKKRVAANGYRLPDPISPGEVLTDIGKKQWKIGRSIGIGGFGEIYLASDDIAKPVLQNAQYVVKIEPHSNGPLFVEMNFYLRVAKSDSIDAWMKSKRLRYLGMPRYVASGSHMYKGQRYRFLVMERFGKDVWKLFLESGRNFSLQTVLNLGIKILDTLEYVHSKDYIHADIKGSNLLVGYQKGLENQVYLVDYGLACRYTQEGKHKEYREDLRKAHDGTIEYTSRDAHIGAHSRRGDLEILGYNLVQWLCSYLPWEDNLSNPEYVHSQKKLYMSNIPSFMKRCFPDGNGPAVIEKFLKYVSSLSFETVPDYEYCRKLLRQGLKELGTPDSGQLVFGKVATENKLGKIKKKASKRKSAEEPENMGEAKLKKAPRSGPREPCGPRNINRMTRQSPTSPVLRSKQFSWEKVLSGDPEILLKRKGSGKKSTDVAKSNCQAEPRGALARRSASVDGGLASIDNPTPAMLEILRKKREQAWADTLLAIQKKNKVEGRCSTPEEFSQPLTPAMEEVLRRREQRLNELTLPPSPSTSSESGTSNGSDETFVPPSMRQKKRPIPKSSVSKARLSIAAKKKGLAVARTRKVVQKQQNVNSRSRPFAPPRRRAAPRQFSPDIF